MISAMLYKLIETTAAISSDAKSASNWPTEIVVFGSKKLEKLHSLMLCTWN